MWVWSLCHLACLNLKFIYAEGFSGSAERVQISLRIPPGGADPKWAAGEKLEKGKGVPQVGSGQVRLADTGDGLPRMPLGL